MWQGGEGKAERDAGGEGKAAFPIRQSWRIQKGKCRTGETGDGRRGTGKGERGMVKRETEKSPTLRERGGLRGRFSEISKDREIGISKVFSERSGYRDIETDYREIGVILLLRSQRPRHRYRWSLHWMIRHWRWYWHLSRRSHRRLAVLVAVQRTSLQRRLGKRS